MVAEDGETAMAVPVPAAVVPHPPVYHCQEAPLPRLPPLTVSVALFPEHTVVVVVLMPVDAVELPEPLGSSSNKTAFELAVAGLASKKAPPPGLKVGKLLLAVEKELNCL